ncbi:uncharacterized protein LOC119466415 [Dermacentor silvarum]|uniref:uncharacterized protein LOC119466415 n=1 Tax=Dermacentor silvarum TaxID=543639 RepID=UPI002100A423|nr:uncharacterized protein LOC119466415 [Dermacentor silvarum]
MKIPTCSCQQQAANRLQNRYNNCAIPLPDFSRTVFIGFDISLQANKKSKQCQAASKSAAYDEILKEHVSSALNKNKAARVSQASTKRHTEDEEEAVTNRERKLKRIRVEACQRQEPYEDVLKERNELRQIVATMTQKMDCKLSAILEMLQSSAPQPQRAQESLTGAASEWEHEHSYDDQERRDKETQHTGRKPMPLATLQPLKAQPTPGTEILDNTSREPAAEALPKAADPKAHGPFTDIGDGKYHVKDGLVIGAKQAEKILGQKKASLVVKDMAQAIWGREGLAERTYGGKLAPKNYRNPTAVVRKQLSPQKVALIIDTVRHWGSMTGVSVKETIDNVSTILSQKIQDVRRSKKNKEN